MWSDKYFEARKEEKTRKRAKNRNEKLAIILVTVAVTTFIFAWLFWPVISK